MRSWLIVPASNPAKLAKAPAFGADVLVVDFHDGGCETTPGTRALVADWLRSHTQSARGFQRWVRIKPVTAPQWREDLDAVMAAGPDGIVMSGVEDADQVRRLASEIYEHEQRNAIRPNHTRLVLQLGASARAVLAIAAINADPHPRLAGLTWDDAALAADLGVAGGVALTSAQHRLRDETLLAAKALGLVPIETAFRTWRDAEGFERAGSAARGDGFEAMLAVHPAQVEPINRTFTPNDTERAEAEAIVARFEQAAGADRVPYEGRVLDSAQLARARRLLTLS